MEETILEILRVIIVIFSLLGILYHLVMVRRPQNVIQVEEKLAKEFGIKKRLICWLEEDRMQLHNWLVQHRIYNIFAIICLVFVAIALFKC